ncbi:MAG TPA: hypothetical protein VLC93_01675, partial [Myxococcota bacterium]|nr:hypothetical protein [Myxococcota bacterium]
MTIQRALTLVLSLALTTAIACRPDPETEVVTAVKLTIAFADASGLDQVRIYANFAHGGGNIFAPIVRPEQPAPLEGASATVVIVFDDENAGRPMILRADGLRAGAIVASGLVELTLGRRQLLEATVMLGAAATCGDRITSLGVEECDDGNGSSGDGCDPYCFIEQNFVCILIGSQTTCVSRFAPACGNAIDDDGDGLADAEDPGCAAAGDTSERGDAAALPCDNGIDDDGDGHPDFRIDERGDPGCADIFDFSEHGANACDDGIDDDNDGLVDAGQGASNDPGCDGPSDTSERGTVVCDDGVDNDGDGRSDFAIDGRGDPGCGT